MIPKWKINKGDVAFFEPKIDVKINDSLKREHQLWNYTIGF